jgi:hypothetical protein
VSKIHFNSCQPHQVKNVRSAPLTRPQLNCTSVSTPTHPGGLSLCPYNFVVCHSLLYSQSLSCIYTISWLYLSRAGAIKKGLSSPKHLDQHPLNPFRAKKRRVKSKYLQLDSLRVLLGSVLLLALGHGTRCLSSRVYRFFLPLLLCPLAARLLTLDSSFLVDLPRIRNCWRRQLRFELPTSLGHPHIHPA